MISILDILNVSLFLLAICLTIWNINQRFNTNKTTSITNHEKLEEIVFPLKFSLLIYPGFDQSKLVEVGYRSPSPYIIGENRFGRPQIGWAGHTKAGSTLGNVSGKLEKESWSKKGKLLELFKIWNRINNHNTYMCVTKNIFHSAKCIMWCTLKTIYYCKAQPHLQLQLWLRLALI